MEPETHILLMYEYVEDILERRAPYREAHLANLTRLKEEGRVLMAGATGDPVTGALIVFAPCDPVEVGEFVLRDPYYEAGLITDWRAVPWTVVV
ncbi:MAG: YciI family protein [Thermoleophilia bacterium]|nr:YciI family protein [Thermoleophilia bacterium]